MKIFTQEENQAWSKTLPGKMCSACLIIKSKDKVLMVKASYKDHWTFPSGIVDENESPSNAAVRETSEEVGLSIRNEDCQLFKIIYTASKNGDRDRFNFAFITEVDDTELELTVPNDEIENAKWVNFDQIAILSKNKGSYLEFQKLLLGSDTGSPYKEI